MSLLFSPPTVTLTLMLFFSEKAYKRKFEEWGLTKNVPKEEGLFMVKKREQRREAGKDTLFWRRRRTEGPLQLVPDDKVDRIADRYSHDLNSYPDSGGKSVQMLFRIETCLILLSIHSRKH
jgi:hypothetical protein